MTEREAAALQDGRLTTTSKREDNGRTEGGQLRRLYGLADDLDLSPHYDLGADGKPARVTFTCPDCRAGAIAHREAGRVLAECLNGCGSIDLEDSRRPLTGATLARSAYTAEELRKAASEPVPWLVDQWLSRKGVTVLTARSGVGKSMLAGELAGRVIHGNGFLTWTGGITGPVAWIDVEQGAQVIGRRLGLQGLIDTVGDTLTIVGPEAIDLVRDEAAIIDWLQRVRPALLIVDSHRMMNPGREEKDSDAQATALHAYRRIAKAIGCAVLVIHHSGKSEGSYVRGSTAIEDQADTVIELRRKEADDPGLLRVTWHKQRQAETPRPCDLRMTVSDGRIEWEAAEAEDDDPILRTALDLIGRAGPQSMNAIAKAAGFTKASQRHRELVRQYVEAGILVRSGDLFDLPATAPDSGAPRRTSTPSTPAPLRRTFSTAQAQQGEQGAHPSAAHPSAPSDQRLSGGELVDAILDTFPGSEEATDAPRD